MFLGEKLETTADLVRRCLQHTEDNETPALGTSSVIAREDERWLRTGSL
jgi:hypothetical protein